MNDLSNFREEKASNDKIAKFINEAMKGLAQLSEYLV